MPPASSIAATDPDRPAPGTAWFRDEVHAHDGQLKAYLRGSFPAVRDVDDVVQESYLRVWKRQHRRPIDSVKAFLFRVARNLALDTLRHERASPVRAIPDLGELDTVSENPSAAENLTRDEKAELLAAALDSLPPKMAQVVFLHRMKGIAVSVIASQLGCPEKTVANLSTLGVARCEQFLRKRGIEFF